MADTNKLKKEIEIAIKVTGDVGANLKAFSTSFKTIADSFTLIQNSLGGMKNIAAEVGTSINAFVSGVGKIELPPKFGEFVNSLSKLNSIKPPNLDKFTTGLSALSTVSVPDSEKMTKIANAIKAFDGITAPSGLADLAKGIKGIHEITKDSDTPITKTAAAITTLTTPLQELGKVKLPNLKNIADGLQGMVGINVGAKSAQFVALETSLRKLDGIKLPNFKNIIDSIHNMKDLNLTAKSLQFNSLATNLRKLDGIKLPNFKQVVDSVHKLGSTPIDPSFHSKLTQIYYALKSFEDVKSAPSFSSLTTSVQKLGALRIPADMPKTLNYLAQELKQFAEIKAPPNFNTLLNSIEKANSFKFDSSLPKNLNYLASELRQFAEIKAPPNLNTLIKSLQAASDFKVPVDLPKRLNYLAQEMKQFAEIKAPPNLNTLIKSIEAFRELKIPADLHTKLGGLADSFKQFDKVRVPNLNTLVKSIKEMGKLTIPDDLGPKLKDIADAFGVFKGVRIPTLKGLADSLEKFKGVTIDPNLAATFKDLASALGPLQGVKVPALGAMVKGMEGMVKMDLNAFKTRVLEVSAALEKLDKDGRLQSFKGFAEALKAVEAKLGRVSIAANTTHERISRVGFAFASATAGLSTFNRNLYGMTRGLTALNSGLASLTGFTAFFGSLYAIKDVSTYLIEFDDAIRKAGTTSQASTAEVQELARAARLVGEATRYTATDAANALKELTQAGLSVNQAIGALPGVMELAASAAIDIKEAAHISTNIMYGYGMSVEDLTFRMDEFGGVAGSVNDILTAAFNRSNTDLTQLGVAFRYAGPVAKSAGLQFEETASILASLAQAGYQGSTAGTTLRRSIANLLSPTKQMQEIMDSYGLSIKNADGSLRPMLQILEDMRNQGITTGDALEIFGKRAGTGMAALLQMGNIELTNMMVNMESAAGIARRNAVDMEAGIGGTWRRLVSQWEELKLALGSEIESNVVNFLEVLTKALNENKDAIVDSVGWILDVVASMVQWGTQIGVLISKNSELAIGSLLLLGIIKQSIDIYRSFIKVRQANLAAQAAEIALNGRSAIATTAYGIAMSKVTMVLTDLKAAFAVVSLWAGRLFTSLIGFAVTPVGASFLLIAAAIGAILLVAEPAGKSLQELIKAQTDSIEHSKKEAEAYRQSAASLKLLMQDYKAYEQAQKKAGITPGIKPIAKIDPDTGVPEQTSTKAGVPAAEELAFSKALQRVVSSIPDAVVAFDDLNHAYLKVGDTVYKTRQEIEKYIEALNEKAGDADIQVVAAAFAKESLLIEEKTNLTEKLNKELEKKKKLEDYAAIYKGAVNDSSYKNRFEDINELNGKIAENSLEQQKNKKVIEDAAVSYLNAGFTVEEFSKKMVKVGSISKDNVKHALDIATSYEVATKRIDLAYDTVNKKYAKQLTALRSQLQEETKEYDDAVKELEMDLKDGLKAFDAFKGAAGKIADIEFGNIDSTDSVKVAQKTLDAINKVYTENNSTRLDLVVKAENELNKARSEEALKGLKRSLASIEEYKDKEQDLALRQLDNEFKLIDDSHRKIEKLQARKNEITRKLDSETASAKVKVTEKALASIEAAYNASLKQEIALKTRLDGLLKTTEELSTSITKAMSDSVRNALTPVGQYYDKLREIDDLESKGSSLAAVGEHEKALELMKQAMAIRSTMGGAVIDDGIEMISQLEAQATMTKGHIKSLGTVHELEAKIRKDVEDKIKAQESVTAMYAEQSKSLTNTVADLKDVLDKGIKLEIKIDIAQAEDKLNAFTQKQSMVIAIKANTKEIQDNINEINNKIKTETSAALVDAVKTMDDTAKAQFFNINKAYKRIYESSATGASGDTIAVENQTKEVEKLKETLRSYLIVEKDVVNVKKALAEADAGRPERLRTIVAALGNEADAIERADKFSNSSIATKKDGVQVEKDYSSAIWSNVKTEEAGTKAKTDNTNAIKSNKAELIDLSKQSTVIALEQKTSLDAHISQVKDAHSVEMQSIAEFNASTEESVLKQKKLEQAIAAKNAEIESATTSFDKLPEISVKMRDDSLTGLDKKFQGKVEEAVRDAHNKEKELTEKLKDDLKQLDAQFNRDTIQRAKDLANAKLDIEGDLKDNTEKINRKLKDDLEKLDRARAKDQKKAAQDILDLRSTTADKIRAIEDRNASAEVKDSHAKEDADRKLYEGRKLIEEGLAKADAAQIERGRKLLEQSSDLYENLKSQQQAKEGVLAVEKDLAKAIDYADQVAAIDKKKEAAIDAENKRREAIIASEDKIKELKIKNEQDVEKAKEKLAGDKTDLSQKALDAREALWAASSAKVIKYREVEYAAELKLINDAHAARLANAAAFHAVNMQYLAEQKAALIQNLNVLNGNVAAPQVGKGDNTRTAQAPVVKNQQGTVTASAPVTSQVIKAIEKDGKMVFTNMIKDGADAVAAVVSNGTEGAKAYAQAIGTGMQAASTAAAGVIKDANGKVIAAIDNIGSTAPATVQIPVVVTGVAEAKKDIVAIAPTTPIAVPIKVAESKYNEPTKSEPTTYDKIKNVSSTISNIGADSKGVRIIGPEQQDEIDAIVEKTRNVFAVMGQAEGAQGLQDMVNALNGVAANAQISREEVTAMSKELQTKLAGSGMALVDDISNGISKYHLVIEATDEAVSGLSKRIESTPFAGYSDAFHESIASSLPYMEDIEESYDNASDKAKKLAKSIKSIELDETTHDSKELGKNLGKTFVKGEKDAEEYSGTLEDIPIKDTSDEFDKLRESAGDALSEPVKEAEELTDAIANVDESVTDAAASFGDAESAVTDFQDTAKDPIELDTSKVAAADKALDKLSTTMEEVPDVTADATVNTEGGEEVAKAKEDVQALKDKEVTVTVNYVTKGTPPPEVEGNRNTETVPSENKDGGFIERVQKFATGGYTRGFRKLPSPYISQGSGGKEDDVPALLQKGEYVQKRSAVQKYGVGFMHALNSGRIDKHTLPQFNTGGVVSAVDSVIQKFASGGFVLSSSINKMKRKLEDELLGYGSNAVSGMNVHLNNTVVNTANNMQTATGLSGLTSMQAAFASAISRFATGGSVSGSSSVDSIKSELNKKYQKDIAKAKSYGNDKLVAILRKEQDDLNEVANQLTIDLNTLETEYLEFKKTTTDEHLARVKEITDTYNETEEKKYGEDTDTVYAKELQELKDSYAEEVADITENNISDKASYDEAMAGYAKDRAELVKEFEDNKLTAKLEQDAAAIEANRIGINIAKSLKLIAEAEPSPDTLRAKQADKSITYGTDGKVVPKDGIKNPLIGTFTWESLIKDKKDTVAVPGYLPKDTETPDFKVIADMVTYINSGGFFKDIASYTDAGLAVESLRKDYTDKDNSLLIKAHNESLLEIEKEEDDEDISYAKSVEDSEKERFDADTEFSKSESELTTNYKRDKESAKKTYDTDLADEKKSFDESMQSALEQYAADIQSAKDSAGSEFASIKDTAATDYAAEKASIDEAAQKLKDDITKGSVSNELGSISSAVSDAIVNSSIGLSFEDFIKKLKRLPTGSSSSLPSDFWKSLDNRLPKFNTGGQIPFSGGLPGVDSILAALTPGEFVVTAPAVQMFGLDFFKALNSFRLPKFNTGGIVDKMPKNSFISSGATVRHALDLTFNGNNIGELYGEPVTIDGFIKAISIAKGRA